MTSKTFLAQVAFCAIIFKTGKNFQLINVNKDMVQMFWLPGNTKQVSIRSRGVARDVFNMRGINKVCFRFDDPRFLWNPARFMIFLFCFIFKLVT